VLANSSNLQAETRVASSAPRLDHDQSIVHQNFRHSFPGLPISQAQTNKLFAQCAVHKPADFAIVLAAFLALAVWKAPPWSVVCAVAFLGAVSTFLS
jgi:hypothetical protein